MPRPRHNAGKRVYGPNSLMDGNARGSPILRTCPRCQAPPGVSCRTLVDPAKYARGAYPKPLKNLHLERRRRPSV